MAERKQTPDVLAEILGGEAPIPEPSAPLPIGRTTELASPRPVPSGGRPGRPGRDTSRAQPVTASAPAPTWEYEIVSLQDAHGWRPRFVNGRELPDWLSGPSIHDYVNQRGVEGWELAAAASGQRLYGTSDLHQLYFRRPRR
jgi:hypothetical protein